MDVNPSLADFFFDAKGHGPENDVCRSSIIDPGSHDLVVNALSEAAASNQFSDTIIDFGEKNTSWANHYPLINPQPGYDEFLVPLSFTNHLGEGASLFQNPAMSPYETSAWQQQEAATIPVNMLTTANQPQSYAPSSWTPFTDQPGPSSAQEMFSMDKFGVVMGSSGSEDTSEQTIGTVVSPPISENPVRIHDYCHSNELYHFMHTGQGAAPVRHPSILGMIQGPFAISNGQDVGVQSLKLQSGDMPNLPSSLGPRESRDGATHLQYLAQHVQLRNIPLEKLNEVSDAQQCSPPTLPAQEDMMANFNIRPQPPSQKRTRKSFTKDGKKKVQLVRKIGACLCCRSRKLSCSANGVCNTCLRLVNNPMLALHICIRSKLRDSYIGVRELHGRSLDRRRTNLQPLISSLTGLPINIQLCVTSEQATGRSTSQLNLQVMKCSSSPLCRWKRLQKMSGIYITSHITYDERYVIVPASLPTIDEYDTFGRSILLMQNDGQSGTITQLLDQFLSLYCSRRSPSRLRRLSNLTSRIASLNNLVAYSFLNLHDGSFDLLNRHSHGGSQQRFVSETVHDQIRLLAAEGLEPAEKLVSSEIDDLNIIAGAGKHARIIAGICVLRLALLYRDRWVRDEIRTGLPNNTNQHHFRLEKAASFYKRLTVAYSILCRESDTPLTVEWEDEGDAPAEEDDPRLAGTFSQLQPAFQQFCEEKLFRQHDDIFRDLIAKSLREQRNRKRRRIES